MSIIAFGTSGYRGIIGDTFTNQHVAAIANAIAHYFKTTQISNPRVLIGYDTRTGNTPHLEENSYTWTLTTVLSHHKIDIDFCDNYAPTPLISWAVRNHDYDLGIILTASHNPPNYNGIKINDSSGSPAPKTLTDIIQTEANRQLNASIPTGPILVQRVNYTHAFCAHLKSLVQDTFNLPMPSFHPPCIIDTKCGSAIDIWKYLTEENSDQMHWINDSFSPDFNFELPDPTSLETRQTLGHHAKTSQQVAFSNDPDADRHVLIDETGQFIPPEKIAAILITYCKNHGISIDSVSSTLANSRLVQTVCQALNIAIHETNIGFKHFTPYLKQASNKKALAFGVESSGGFSVSNHTFDKCGFLPILLILGIMKKQHMTLSELSNHIDDTYPPFIFIEDAIEYRANSNDMIQKCLGTSQDSLNQLFNVPIETLNHNDGLKILFKNNDWILFRPSGTEPIIRIYAESNTHIMAQNYIEKAKLFLLGTTA